MKQFQPNGDAAAAAMRLFLLCLLTFDIFFCVKLGKEMRKMK